MFRKTDTDRRTDIFTSSGNYMGKISLKYYENVQSCTYLYNNV
jgi:hypothetical protein